MRKTVHKPILIATFLFFFLILFSGCGSDNTNQDQTANATSASRATDEGQESVTESETTESDQENAQQTDTDDSEYSMSEASNSDLEVIEEDSVPSCAWNVAPKISGEANIIGGNILADARIGAQEGYDRFVLEFVDNGTLPKSYNIEYVFDQNGGNTTIVTDNRHLGFEVQGNIALQIQLAGSHWDIVNNVQVYEGSDTLSSSLMGNIIEAKFGGSHAGIILWGIGVQKANGYRILELTSPPRIVIDICTSDESDKLTECLNAGSSWEYPEWVNPNFLTSYCDSNF